MARFYTPMNPTYVTQQQQTHEPTLQPPSKGISAPEVPPPLGAGAALMIANLTTIPGFLSDSVIQEARQEYSHQQQHMSHGQYTVGSSTQAPTHDHYSSPATTQYSQLDQHDSGATDPSSTIESLLMELKQTGQQHPAQTNLLQPLEPSNVEDYSNGKITPQLLKKLAALAESDAQQGGVLLKEIRMLRERQMKAERSLFEKREELLAKHKRDLVKLQANEIMGINVSNQIQQTKVSHLELLKQFDKGVVYELDKEITHTQRSLSKSGVPMMSCTSDPIMVSSQIRVLRLLEDMLNSS
ncbi:hypothetical protein BGZ76_008240 [Entomortierella beljakovae]|nr:hypothetical protein BGZ76_008240 [Entomortierella beljakovae]